MSAERMGDDADTGDAHRIPRVYPPSAAAAFPSQQQQQQQRVFAPTDLMLGLKTLAAHADRQAPLLSHDSNPMPTFPSLRVSPLPAPAFSGTARLPSIAGPEHREQDAQTATTLSPLRFGEYLGRKHKRGDERLPDDASSPTARAQVFSADRGITLSPPSAAAPAPRILPVATTIAWRSSNPIFAPTNKRFRPESPLGESKDAFKPELQSNALPMSTLTRSVSGPASSVQRSVPGPPVLVRRVSSRWRSELADQERRKTRERIQRGLTKYDERDYEVLLLLIASMEEELLHVKTTSRAHYFHQAQELSSEIRHASLER